MIIQNRMIVTKISCPSSIFLYLDGIKASKTSDKISKCLETLQVTLVSRLDKILQSKIKKVVLDSCEK